MLLLALGTVLPKQNKMSAFHAQNPTRTCVWHGQKLTPHHTKNKKEVGSPEFLFFSMVWGDLDVTRDLRCSSFGHEKRTFYSAMVIRCTVTRGTFAQTKPDKKIRIR
jgi:hypothetical protein